MDKILLYVLLGGYAVIAIYWMITDPRTLKERFDGYVAIRKNALPRFVILTFIALLIITNIFPIKHLTLQLHASVYDGLLIMLGLLLYFIGFGIALWARIVMKEKWLPAGTGHNTKRQTKLFTTGPFRFTRNPIYLGILLLYSGFFIALRSPLLIAVIIPWIFFYYSAVQEEKYLEKQFGKEYLAYKKRVPRFLFA